MATYTVTNTASTGPGSLAAALAAAKNGDTVQFAVGGTITLSGTTALPAGSVIFDTTDAGGTAHDVTVGGGALADAARSTSALVKTGDGTLTLTNAANTYSGGTTLSGGTLDVPSPTSNPSDPVPVSTLGTGTIAFDGGTLGLSGVKLGNSATIDAKGGGIFVNDVIYGVGNLNVLRGSELDGDFATAPGTAAGVFTVSAAPAEADFSGGGNLVLTGNDAFSGGLVLQNASVDIGNDGTAGILTGNVTGSSSGTGYGSLAFSHAAGVTTTYAGNISGAIGFVQGDGITVLTGTNTYSRATTFDTGTLRAGSAGAFSPGSQMIADSSDAEEVATIDLAGFDETIGGLLASHPYGPDERDVVTNSVGAAVTLTIAAGGPSTPYATQQNQNYGGYGRYFDGVVEDGDPALGGGTLAIDVAGNLNLAQPSTYSGGTVIEAGGTLTFLSQSADGTDKGIKIGGNAFGGVRGAIVDNGTLALVALAYGGPATPQAVANAISGSGGVTMTVDPYNAARDGIVVLTGHNTYTGATLVDHGTLEGGVANAFGTDSAVIVNGNTFGHGATLDLDGNAQAIGALSGDSGGVVTDSGAAAVLTVGGGDGGGTFLGTLRDGAGALALIKTGAGTETLAGTDSYTGGTTIAAGTLDFASDAALPPGMVAFAGSAATLKLDAAPANGATFADPLSGLAPGDALDLAGLAFAAGATAAVQGNRLAVTSGGTTEYFTLAGAATTAFAVTRDAAGGTLVTGLVPPTAPVVAGTHGTADAAEATVTPFAGVTVADGNAGATDRLTIVLTGGGGALTDPNGLLARNADGSYALAATDPATLSRELDALRFTPANGTPGATATTTFVLAVASSAGTTATDGGTTVTDTAAPAPVPTPPPAPPPAPTPPDSITVDQAIDYDGAGTFTLTGTAFSAVGIRNVEFTAEIDGQADQPVDLGAATVNPDGTFSFTDDVGGRLQGFITATETDDAGLQTQAAFRPALQGGRSPHADRYSVTPTDVTYTGSTYYRADGSHRVTVTAPGQTLTSAFFDAYENDGAPETTFVFDPGFGRDAVGLFRVDGADHDTLSFKGSDFGNAIAAVLNAAHDTRAGLLITDPTASSPGGGPGTHDTLLLKGITKAQLVQNQADIAFHA